MPIFQSRLYHSSLLGKFQNIYRLIYYQTFQTMIQNSILSFYLLNDKMPYFSFKFCSFAIYTIFQGWMQNCCKYFFVSYKLLQFWGQPSNMHNKKLNLFNWMLVKCILKNFRTKDLSVKNPGTGLHNKTFICMNELKKTQHL